MNEAHYHDVGEVNGAARDGHSHFPRDLGAAEEHDLEMLRREVRSAGATIATLERQNSAQHRQLAEQGALIEELRHGLADLAGLVSDLSSKTAQSLEVISSAVQSIGG